MKFVYDKKDWTTIEEGEKNCYLLTNGLGGYSSLSLIGAAARNDQAILMAAKKAPNVRWHLISNVLEEITIDGVSYTLTSQRMKDGQDLQGFQYLEQFIFDDFPTWIYRIEDVVIRKTIIMVHGENVTAIAYQVTQEKYHDISLKVTPLLRITPKKIPYSEQQEFHLNKNGVSCDGYQIFEITSGTLVPEEGHSFGPMYFSQDERDGREEYGSAYINHAILLPVSGEKSDNCVIFSTELYEYHEGIFQELFEREKAYYDNLQKLAKMESELGKQLVISADAYVVNRDSTKGKSIIAGYPFFEDWGRDTMISLPGITMVTGRFSECKSILRTFAKYVKDGLLPNLFPEGGADPMYNSVDAPLLFVNAVYEYIEFSGDEEFLYEIWSTLEKIVEAYQQGTNYHIKMDEDGLIQAGAGLEQLTWMDVRVGDYLPTPRHGKPVEINAYWYNALCVMSYFAEKMAGREGLSAEHAKGFYEISGSYSALSTKVKASFLDKFWNEKEQCLKDVLCETEEENQVRCNQVWALSLPFTMLTHEMEDKVLKKIREELYTTIGLRTLSPKDKAFHDIYIGDMVRRDKAYHQGTVWAFPLGAYYRANMRYIKQYTQEDHTERMEELKQGMQALQDWLKEGCVAQIAEIYDGAEPTVSRGCFAQAWSVGELLRAVYDWEKLNK